MNPGTNAQYRRPSEAEKAYIDTFWLPDLQRRIQPNAYKIILGLGWAFSILLGLSLTVVPVSAGNQVVFAVIAAIFLMVGRIQRKSFKKRKKMLEWISQGQYWVTEVFAERLLIYPRGSLPKAACQIQGLGQFRMPYSPVAQLVERKVQAMPVLLIRFDGESETLATPKPGYHA